jgi:CheY-like chemotaxis protein/HPt (histidine-containing phosphotransfer) domain-containing protein
MRGAVADGEDREFLRSVFLLDAWNTLAAVEQGLVALASGADAGGEALRVVTRWLRGAAGVSGFPRVSALANVMEAVVDRAAGAPLADRQRAVEQLGDLVGSLKHALDIIATIGEEDVAALDAVLARYDAPAAGAAAAEPAGPLAELDRFFVANPDVVKDFVPQAIEHLGLIVQSLRALERDYTNGAELSTLFHAVQTLKGAADTVGCQAIGALAHRIAALLGQVREHGQPLAPATLEAVYAGLNALRLMLRSAHGVPVGRSEAFARAVLMLEEQAPAVSPAPVEPIPVEPAAPEPAIPAAIAPAVPPSSIHVHLDRLDPLLNLAGEPGAGVFSRHPPHGGGMTNAKVLVVDDSLSLRKVVEKALAGRSVEVLSAASGAEAIERIERDCPDIVVCDVILPDKDGYQICQFVRAHPAMGKTPVLLISDVVNSTVLARAAEVQSNDVVFKPVHADELVRKIDALLGGPANGAPATPAASAHRPSAPAVAPAPLAAPAPTAPAAGAPRPSAPAVASAPLAAPAPPAPGPADLSGTTARQGDLKARLAALAGTAGVRWAALADREGYLIECAGDAVPEVEVASALAACLSESSEGIGRELGQGALLCAILEYEGGVLLLHGVGPTALLAVLVSAAPALGKVRYFVKKALPGIQQEL